MTMRSWLSQSGRVVRCDQGDGDRADAAPGTIVQLRFTDAARGWALAFNRQEYTNALLRTTDGGAHWQRVQIP